MRLIYGAKSSVGCIRQNNQDAFYLPKEGDLPFFAVADGMGGTNGGEIASILSISTVCTHLKDNIGSESDIATVLRTAINQANRAIYRVGRIKSEYSRMGTTFTCAYLDGDIVCVAHVGDSRAYKYNNGALRQITVDHSYVQELVNAGQITMEEARTHPDRHKITRAVGVGGLINVDTFYESVKDGDIYLLCSDGLTSMLSDAEISQIISHNVDNDPYDIASALVKAAEYAGGHDNITVVIIKNN